MNIEQQIRDEAKKLLESGDVEAVIGFTQSTFLGLPRPFVARTPEDAEKLVFNRFCRYNIAGYVNRMKGKKVAIVAKGCDSRSLGVLIAEKQVDRANLRIIGVPCEGMISRKKLEAKFGKLAALRKISLNENKVHAETVTGEKLSADIDELLHDSCKRCMHRNPVHYDVLVGEPVEENIDVKEHFAVAVEMYKKPASERWKFFSEMFLKCIRCYACRQACPTCYCEECFVDSRFPHWLDKGQHPTDIIFWHIGRLYHQAGRCVECGNCSEVCPVDIDFDAILAYQAKKVWERYGYDAGVAVDEPPPLQNYRVDDPQEFFL